MKIKKKKIVRLFRIKFIRKNDNDIKLNYNRLTNGFSFESNNFFN